MIDEYRKNKQAKKRAIREAEFEEAKIRIVKKILSERNIPIKDTT